MFFHSAALLFPTILSTCLSYRDDLRSLPFSVVSVVRCSVVLLARVGSGEEVHSTALLHHASPYICHEPKFSACADSGYWALCSPTYPKKKRDLGLETYIYMIVKTIVAEKTELWRANMLTNSALPAITIRCTTKGTPAKHHRLLHEVVQACILLRSML